jgi:hypothetical protein
MPIRLCWISYVKAWLHIKYTASLFVFVFMLSEKYLYSILCIACEGPQNVSSMSLNTQIHDVPHTYVSCTSYWNGSLTAYLHVEIWCTGEVNLTCLIVNSVCHISCLLRSWEGNTRRMDGSSIISINVVTGFYTEIKPRLLVSLWGSWREPYRCSAVNTYMKSIIICMRFLVSFFSFYSNLCCCLSEMLCDFDKS